MDVNVDSEVQGVDELSAILFYHSSQCLWIFIAEIVPSYSQVIVVTVDSGNDNTAIMATAGAAMGSCCL